MTTAELGLRPEPARRTGSVPWRVVALAATAAGVLSGLRIYFVYGAVGVPVSLADGVASGLLDAWLWIPFVPVALGLAGRFEPAGGRALRALAVHAAASLPVSFAQLTLFAAASGVVRALRYGDAFRVDLASPLFVMLAPGCLVYAALVALGWWRAGRAATEVVMEPAAAPVLAFRAGRGRVFLGCDEIDWVGASGNYLELHAGADTHLVRETLASAHERLGRRRFVRIHRSRLVRREAIARVVHEGGAPRAVLRDGTQLGVGRSYRAALEEVVP